jgi:hypothetical protein
MRRVVLLTLMTVAVSTAALANSITTGTFVRGTAGRNPTTGVMPQPTFTARVIGSLGDIEIRTTDLSTGCNVTGNGSCTFATGEMTVRTSGGVVLFMDSLDDGTIKKTDNVAFISADILPSAEFPTGGIVHMSLRYSKEGPPFSGTLIGGSATANPVPEPSALLLLGTGVIGLAGTMRHKLYKWRASNSA